MRAKLRVAVVVLMAFALASCGGGAPGKGKVTVGVSLLTRTHPFYQELEAGLRDGASRRDIDLVVEAGGVAVARPKEQIESFLVQRVSAIVVAPCDSKSIGTTIAAANRAGIPVFTTDIAVLAPDAKVVCHVASDNLAGGRLAAELLADALGGTGKIAIIDHPEVESVLERVKGFESGIKARPGLEIVAKLSGRGTKDGAFRVAEDLLQAHPDLDGIFGINDDSALGALAAVEKAGKSGRVAIVGYDATPEARAAIRDGKILADVVQLPRKMGFQTIMMVADHLAGTKVPSRIQIPCATFRKKDALGS
jgi:ribose transport system substrate-binding protein